MTLRALHLAAHVRLAVAVGHVSWRLIWMRAWPPRIAVQKSTVAWYSRSVPGCGPCGAADAAAAREDAGEDVLEAAPRRPTGASCWPGYAAAAEKPGNRSRQSRLGGCCVRPTAAGARRPRPSPGRSGRSRSRPGRRSCASSRRSDMSLASEISLNFSSARLSLGFTSGWYLRAAFLKALRISSGVAVFLTPSVA